MNNKDKGYAITKRYLSGIENYPAKGFAERFAVEFVNGSTVSTGFLRQLVSLSEHDLEYFEALDNLGVIAPQDNRFVEMPGPFIKGDIVEDPSIIEAIKQASKGCADLTPFFIFILSTANDWETKISKLKFGNDDVDIEGAKEAFDEWARYVIDQVLEEDPSYAELMDPTMSLALQGLLARMSHPRTCAAVAISRPWFRDGTNVAGKELHKDLKNQLGESIPEDYLLEDEKRGNYGKDALYKEEELHDVLNSDTFAIMVATSLVNNGLASSTVTVFFDDGEKFEGVGSIYANLEQAIKEHPTATPSSIVVNGKPVDSNAIGAYWDLLKVKAFLPTFVYSSIVENENSYLNSSMFYKIDKDDERGDFSGRSMVYNLNASGNSLAYVAEKARKILETKGFDDKDISQFAALMKRQDTSRFSKVGMTLNQLAER